MKVEMMDVDEIKTADFNPVLRTKPNKLMALMDDIAENGIEVPLIIGSDGILGDGHRRLYCAKHLGIKKVPVIRSKRTSIELYTINKTQKPTRGGEWLQAVHQGFPIDLVPKRYRREIENLQRVLSKDEFSEIAENGKSPTVMQFARFVGRFVGDTSDDMLRRIVKWFYKHGMQYKARKAIEEGASPQVILRAINEDRPIIVIYK